VTRDPAPSARSGVDRRGMLVLASGHACVDACQGAVPALLPFLVDRHGLSFAAASALVLATTVSSALVQPLFGAFSDRISSPWLMPGGVALGCAGVAAAGIAPSYPLVFVAVLLSGLGIAAFHPEGSRFANHISGTRRATGMGYFSLGGNIGFALGPIFVTPVVLIFGLTGTLAFLIPGAVVAWVLRSHLAHLLAFRPAPRPAHEPASRADDSWRGLVGLLVVISSRSFAFYTLLALVPLYFIDVLDTSDATANAALTGMLVAGAVGTLAGGMLADRAGRRPVLVASLLLQTPILITATTVDVGPAMVLFSLFGFVAISSFSVTIVMGQEYLPSRIGLASGFTLGAGVGIGGLAAPVFGWIGDEFGLLTSMQLLAVLPLIGAAVALALPTAAASRRNLAAARAAAFSDP
jgi:FSR family fosmidomycin resistance protein-like MFS transporter